MCTYIKNDILKHYFFFFSKLLNVNLGEHLIKKYLFDINVEISLIHIIIMYTLINL